MPEVLKHVAFQPIVASPNYHDYKRHDISLCASMPRLLALMDYMHGNVSVEHASHDRALAWPIVHFKSMALKT
jgi:hypothetical protein